jgi:hypothetical protein
VNVAKNKCDPPFTGGRVALDGPRLPGEIGDAAENSRRFATAWAVLCCRNMLLGRSLALLAVSSMLAACSPKGSATMTNEAADAASDDAGAEMLADACARPRVLSALDAATYDQSCSTYADCVGIDTTVVCVGCASATAAINVGAAQQEAADYARAAARCPPASCLVQPTCGAAPPTLLACVANRCTLIPCERGDCVDVPEGCSPSCSADEICAVHTCRPLCGPDKPCTAGTKCNDATICLPPRGCELPDGGIADGGCSTVCYGYCE